MKTLLKHTTALIIALMCLSVWPQRNESEPLWLTVDNFEHGPNQWFYLRKSFDLEQNPQHSKIKISVDSKYWLWVNGKMVVFEGMVKRGPNPNDTYYDQLDLKEYFKKGKNTIAVLAWYFGKDGFSHKDSRKFGFFFDGHIGEKHVVSDSSWRIKRSSSYQGMSGEKLANYRLPEGDVSYNSIKEIQDWQDLCFDDSSWTSATVVGPEGASPWNKLIKRPIPQWKDFGLTKATDLRRNGNRVTLKLPYNMQFSFWIKIKAKKGQKVIVSTDSYPWLNDTPIRGEYVATDGVQSYEHYPWLSGHEVYFDFDEGVELLEAGYRETGYNSEMDGKFIVDDQYMMRLLQKAERTLYVNMRDTYFDCPDRERAQWWGDLVLLMEESFYVLDNNANDLSQKAIRELVDWQKENGVLFSPIPAGNWDRELPQQMLAAIALGFKNYYQYTGDLKTYTYVYPHVKKYLGLWKIDDNGHVNFKKGGWNWSDWGEQVDTELLEHAWYYMALLSYADIAKKVGESAEAETTLKTAERIKDFVNKNYWTKEGYRSKSYKEEIDDRGNGMMVVAGIAGKDKYDTIANLLKIIRHSSPYMDKYELEALFLMKKEQQAMERIRTRYKEMTDSDLTTLWELFSYGNWSYNHGWSGGPLSMMYKYVAGIQPTKPGFEQFQVFPNTALYKKMECSFSSVKGKIGLEYSHLENGKIELKVDVPADSEALIRIPVEKIGSEQISGKSEATLVESMEDSNFHYFKVSSGTWNITY